MYRTKRIYHSIAYFETTPEARFEGQVVQSRFLEWMGKSWPMRIVWGAGFARRLGHEGVRRVVIAIGFGMTLSMLIRG